MIASANTSTATMTRHWLSALISPLDIGHSDPSDPKKIVRLNSRRKILSAYAQQRYGMVDRWSSARYQDHESGADHYYYTSGDTGVSLICIDIDCHQRGTHEEALRYAEHLRDEHWDDLYYCASTSGRGVHAYLIVDWGHTPIDIVRDRLSDIERWLDSIAADEGFGVDQVEVCGTPTERVWGRGRNELTDIRMGQLARLPRDIDMCESTERVQLSDLTDLARGESTPVTLPFPVATPAPVIIEVDIAAHGVAQSTGKPRGSVHGKHIRREMIDALMEIARGIVADFAPKVKCEKTLNITPEHVAAFLALADFFGTRPNADGSNPTARMKSLWQACYADGTITVQYHTSITAAIRDCLTDRGLVDMVDSRYATPALQLHDPDLPEDQRPRGYAMQWSVSADTLDAYRQILTGEYHADCESRRSLDQLVRDHHGSLDRSIGQREALRITSAAGSVADRRCRPVRVTMSTYLSAHPPPLARVG